MNTRIKGIASSCALLCLGMLTSNLAQAVPDVAVEAKLGTLGYGVEVIAPITPDRLRVRVGANGGSLKRSYTDQDIKYDMNMKFNSASAILDFHPFAGAFRLSGGLLYNKNRLDLAAHSADGYDFNGTHYTSAQTGNINGSMTFNKTAPYLGFGWGNAVSKDKRLTFMTEVGVLFQGSPHVALSASNPGNDPTLARNVEAARQKMESDAKNFRYYPVISTGLAFKF